MSACKIRWLHAEHLPDLQRELRLINQDAEEEFPRDKVNFNFIFKFSCAGSDELRFLVRSATERDIPVWVGRGEEANSAVIGFPHRHATHKFAAVTGTPGKQLEMVLHNRDCREWRFTLPRGILRIDHPLLMGILNVTPDSFSDGGRYVNPDRAADRAEQMAGEGADIIDIGAESTRPGSRPVNLEEEWARLEPVIRTVSRRVNLPLSVDTYKSEIARRALAEGADIINDISGLTFDPVMRDVAAAAGVPVVIMHIQGTPRDMQQNPTYRNLMEEIFDFLAGQAEYARRGGVDQVILDPGIGFGKRLEDNFEIIRRLPEFRILGYPLLLGPSRKSFLRSKQNLPAEERVWGTAAAVAAGIARYCGILRVHDVEPMKRVCEVMEQISQSSAE